MKELILNDDDLIFISDVDEIPDVEVIEKIKQNKHTIDDLYELRQDIYYYNLTLKLNQIWRRSKVVPYYHYCNKYKRDCEYMRMSWTPNHCLAPCGWHLSYFMDEDAIANKIKNFSHQELNKDEFTNVESLKQKIDSGLDLFGRRKEKLLKIKIEENDYLPKKYNILLK